MYTIDDKEGAIRAVQRFLLELHYSTKKIPFVTIDGIFGDTTRAAVREYQTMRKLPRTGTVDLATWRMLYRDYHHAIAVRNGLQKIPPDSHFPLALGARGAGVASLQRLLNALASRYGLAMQTDVTGVYSYATAAVVNAIRRIYALPEDGTVNGEMFDKMLRDYGYPTDVENTE